EPAPPRPPPAPPRAGRVLVLAAERTYHCEGAGGGAPAAVSRAFAVETVRSGVGGPDPTTGAVGVTRQIPEASVTRLPVYLRALGEMAARGTHTVSGEALAAAAGVNSAKIRKDLSYLGSYGTRGVGYDVEYL